MGGSGGGSQETTQTTTPWSKQQPYLKDIWGSAQDYFGSGQLSPVAPQSAAEQAGIGMGQEAALGGGFGFAPAAQELGLSTIGGDYLTGETNPYMQGAIEYAQQPVINAWNQQIKPGIDATFANTAGGMGSGAYAAKVAQEGDVLARNLAGAATQAGMQNYGQERQRQLQTMGMAPNLEALGYAPAESALRYGGLETQRGQFEQGAPARNLAEYARLIYGSPQFGTTTGSQDANQGFDPYSTIAGVGLLGAGMFCDWRLKRDITRIGTLAEGIGLYTFRYLWNDELRIGPMAQEVEKVRPDAVFEVCGYKAVNVGVL